jgi:hypothetical protein
MKTMKLILCLAVVVLLLPIISSCHAGEPTPSPSSTPVPAFAIVLADTGEVLLTESDIASYNREDRTLELNNSGIGKWNTHLTYPDIPKLADSLYGREFILKVGGEEICRGKFWSGVSSASVNGVVIVDALFKLGADRNVIWIDSSYPGGRALDPSIDLPLRRVLPAWHDEFAESLAKALRDSNTLDVLRYSTGRTVRLTRDDSRYDTLAGSLRASTTQNVTNKSTVVIENGTPKTIDVTVPYALGIVLTFKLGDGSELKFNCTSRNVWFETDRAIFQASVSADLGPLLDKLLE